MTTKKFIATEPPEKPTRRKFPAEFKLKILDEIDQNPEITGLILRREGLYSSNLVTWKRWREKMGEGRSKNIYNENDKLKRENERLKMKLKRAETIIELQKKISQILDEQHPRENGENQS